MADTEDDMIIAEIASGEILPKIIMCVGEKDFSIFVPALRALGNILTTNDHDITERALFEGALDKLTTVLYSPNANLIKEVCWALSNICAGPVQHIHKLIDSTAFDRVFFLSKSYNIDHRKEALWVICNSITGGDLMIKEKVLTYNNGEVIDILINGMKLHEARLIRNILEALEELLKLDKINGWVEQASVANTFNNKGGLDSLEELQRHPNMEIYHQSSAIL
jgi:importin subunit alpha-1